MPNSLLSELRSSTAPRESSPASMSDAEAGTVSPMTAAVTVATVDRMASLSTAGGADATLVRLPVDLPPFLDALDAFKGLKPAVNSSNSVDLTLSLCAKTGQLNGLTPTTGSADDEMTRSSVLMPSSGWIIPMPMRCTLASVSLQNERARSVRA